MTTPSLPPGLDAIMDYIGGKAAAYGHLKWNEVSKLKADMMNVRERWLVIPPSVLAAKCRAIGLREEDTALVIDLLQRMQQGRRLVPERSYRDFQFRQTRRSIVSLRRRHGQRAAAPSRVERGQGVPGC